MVKILFFSPFSIFHPTFQTRSEEWIAPQAEEEYQLLTVRMWGKGIVERGVMKGSEIAAKRMYVVRPQQFIISRIDARHGASGLIPDKFDGAITTNEFPIFNTNPSVLIPQYLGWLSKTPDFIELCKAASEGTTNRVRLKEDKFLNLEIPLPSLEEQRRIVARIEELETAIGEARGLRNYSLKEVELFTNKISGSLFRNLSELSLIQDIADVVGGLQKTPKRNPAMNPVRYLTVAHVQRNRLILDDPRYFEVSKEELEKLRLIPGDVLIVEGNGSIDQVGRAALFKGEISDCIHQNHVIRVRPIANKLLPDFLNCYLNSSVGQEVVKENSRTTSGLYTLSVGRIKNMSIPVPSLPEQQHIVTYLDDLQVKIDSLKRLQAETAAELDALLPSILDKAFKGEL